MRKKFCSKISFIALFFLMTICRCEKESISNLELLTNGSSKIWHINKILTNDLVTVEQPICRSDDEHNFMSNGQFLVDNMGTILKVDYQVPPHCKDTLRIIYSYNWYFNSTMDSIIIQNSDITAVSKILKLTSDSLIIRYAVNPTWFQTEYYVSELSK